MDHRQPTRPHRMTIQAEHFAFSDRELLELAGSVVSMAVEAQLLRPCTHCGEQPGFVKAGPLTYCAGCWDDTTRPPDTGFGSSVTET